MVGTEHWTVCPADMTACSARWMPRPEPCQLADVQMHDYATTKHFVSLRLGRARSMFRWCACAVVACGEGAAAALMSCRHK